MSCSMRKNKHFLKLLSIAPHYQKTILIESATPSQLRSLLEFVDNIWHKHITIEEEDKEELKPFKKQLIDLLDIYTVYGQKKKILLKKNGELLAQLAELLESYIGFCL